MLRQDLTLNESRHRAMRAMLVVLALVLLGPSIAAADEGLLTIRSTGYERRIVNAYGCGIGATPLTVHPEEIGGRFGYLNRSRSRVRWATLPIQSGGLIRIGAADGPAWGAWEPFQEPRCGYVAFYGEGRASATVAGPVTHVVHTPTAAWLPHGDYQVTGCTSSFSNEGGLSSVVVGMDSCAFASTWRPSPAGDTEYSWSSGLDGMSGVVTAAAGRRHEVYWSGRPVHRSIVLAAGPALFEIRDRQGVVVSRYPLVVRAGEARFSGNFVVWPAHRCARTGIAHCPRLAQ